MPNTSPPPPPKSLSTGRKIAFSLIVLTFFLAVVVAVGEILVRHHYSEKYAPPPPPPPPYDTAQKDERLGWRMTPNYNFSGKMLDETRQEYELLLRYDENGFKVFGDTASDRPKVLFLGDSYTASIEVSNEKSFFSLLADSLGFEVFAYGHAGFGTLQEYLVLDEWADRIRPDVVVWEVCSNDFIDNYAPLEIACGYKVGERRPYLSERGEISYRRPLSLWQRGKEKLMFFKWLEERWHVLQEKYSGKKHEVGEYFISVEKRAFQPFDQSVKITGKIIGMVKARLPEGTPVLGFSADVYQPQRDEFQRIFEEHGYSFTPDPALEVDRVKIQEKQTVKAIDGYHWNERGHEIVARTLIPHLAPLLGQNFDAGK